MNVATRVSDRDETGWFTRAYVHHTSRSRHDVIETTLSPVYLLFHVFHLVQVATILHSNEMSSVGNGRFIGMGALLVAYVLGIVSTVRHGAIAIGVARVSLLSTSIFLLAVIPPMTAAAWRLHGTWIGVISADALICYAVLRQQRVRVIGASLGLLAVFVSSVWQIDGANLVVHGQFIAASGNYFAVMIALMGISGTARSIIRARGEAQTALAAAQERNRFHRLIHDAALQPLEALAGGWDVDLPAIQENARQQAVLLRAAIREEAGLDDLVLGDRLQTLATQWTGRGVAIALSLEAPNLLLAPTLVDALVGGAGEAIANVLKHSGVRRAELRSWIRNGHVYVSIVDDGRGFDSTSRPEGMGITLSIRNRLREVRGNVNITSSPGKGTNVTMSVPC